MPDWSVELVLSDSEDLAYVLPEKDHKMGSYYGQGGKESKMGSSPMRMHKLREMDNPED
jgi:hypothetical protein